MGRMYAIPFYDTIDAGAQHDLVEITAPSDAIVVVHGIRVGQQTLGPLTTEDVLGLGELVRLGSSGSGGSGGSATPLESGDAAFGGSVEINNSTLGGTPTDVYAEVFNLLAGWFYTPTPEQRIVVSPSGILALRITNPTNATTGSNVDFGGIVTVEEIGG